MKTISKGLAALVATSIAIWSASASLAETTAKPASARPASAKPVPTKSKPAAKPTAHPAATAHKPTAGKPAAHKPATHKPTAHKPAAHKPAAHKPVHGATVTKHPPTKAPVKKVATPPSVAPAHAQWTTVTEGFALAKQLHKPIVVDFFTDWCGWCKVMDEKTFHEPSVDKLLATQFVTVRANAEDGGEGQKLAGDAGVRAYPTIIIFDANGTPKAQMEGYKEAEPFKTVLNDYLAGKLKPGS